MAFGDDYGWSAIRTPIMPAPVYKETGLEMSRNKPNTLVFEVQNPDAKKLSISPQIFSYAANPENPKNVDSAIKRRQVIECAAKLRNMQREVSAYFNGKDVTDRLVDVLKAYERREFELEQLPVIDVLRTHKKPE
jgi:hypothetical protein